jgi:hypothetical protein
MNGVNSEYMNQPQQEVSVGQANMPVDYLSIMKDLNTVLNISLSKLKNSFDYSANNSNERINSFSGGNSSNQNFFGNMQRS